MIGLGCFSDIVFMIFRSNVAEDLRSVVDVGVDEFFKEVSRWDIDF